MQFRSTSIKHSPTNVTGAGEVSACLNSSLPIHHNNLHPRASSTNISTPKQHFPWLLLLFMCIAVSLLVEYTILARWQQQEIQEAQQRVAAQLAKEEAAAAAFRLAALEAAAQEEDAHQVVEEAAARLAAEQAAREQAQQLQQSVARAIVEVNQRRRQQQVQQQLSHHTKSATIGDHAVPFALYYPSLTEQYAYDHAKELGYHETEEWKLKPTCDLWKHTFSTARLARYGLAEDFADDDFDENHFGNDRLHPFSDHQQHHDRDGAYAASNYRQLRNADPQHQDWSQKMHLEFRGDDDEYRLEHPGHRADKNQFARDDDDGDDNSNQHQGRNSHEALISSSSSSIPNATISAFLEQYLSDLHNYQRKVQEFAPLPYDLRSLLFATGDGGTSSSSARSQEELCQLVELHPQGIQGIFANSSQQLSWLEYTDYHYNSKSKNASTKLSSSSPSSFSPRIALEPLLPPLRHPDFCHVGHSALLNLGFLIHDFGAMCRRLRPTSRIILIDMGASLNFHDDYSGGTGGSSSNGGGADKVTSVTTGQNGVPAVHLIDDNQSVTSNTQHHIRSLKEAIPRNVSKDSGSGDHGSRTARQEDETMKTGSGARPAGDDPNPATKNNRNIDTMPAVYLTELYRKFGFHFDHIYAFEKSPTDPNKVYGANSSSKLPLDLYPSYHWINVAVSADPRSPLNPLHSLLRHYRPHDLILVKLDIDHAATEVPLTLQLLLDSNLTQLVDAFYFEHHVHMHEMAPWWSGTMVGSVQESLELFRALRQQGIAAHSWV